MADNKTIRVKVIKTYYNEEVNLVKWLIEDIESGNRKTIAFKGDDLGPAMGIKGKLLPEHIKNLCENIKGKEFNHVDIADEMPAIPKGDAAIDGDMKTMHDHLDAYPFFEVMQDGVTNPEGEDDVD